MNLFLLQFKNKIHKIIKKIDNSLVPFILLIE